MRAPLALAGLALLAAGLSAPTYAATAAPDCQGLAPTIVDLDGGDVQGTSGSDVILAAGESTIVAGDGSDRICLQQGVVFAGKGHDSVYVAGEIEQESLDIRDAENLDVTIGAGGGFVQLVGFRKGHGTVDVSGGAFLELIGNKEVAVDLEDDTLRMDRAGFTLRGNPTIFAIARDVALVGDEADNNLSVNQFSCAITMKGGRGADQLTVAGSDGDLPFPGNCGGTTRPKVYGQKGDDVLQGRGGPDTLIGGPGQDEAYGGFSTDVCRAEVEKNCER